MTKNIQVKILKKKLAFSDSFKCQYIIYTTANVKIVTIFESSNYNANKKNNRMAKVPKLCIKIGIHLMSHINVKKSKGHISKN